MNSKNLTDLLKILTVAIQENVFEEDKQKIQDFFSELKKIKKELPTIDKLEKLKKIEIDLEVKYDRFNELSYYFEPLYVEIKNEIHNENIKKIREENRRKKEVK